jgi:hypothetical protein
MKTSGHTKLLPFSPYRQFWDAGGLGRDSPAEDAFELKQQGPPQWFVTGMRSDDSLVTVSGVELAGRALKIFHRF